jgi:hypothetical protein
MNLQMKGLDPRGAGMALYGNPARPGAFGGEVVEPERRKQADYRVGLPQRDEREVLMGAQATSGRIMPIAKIVKEARLPRGLRWMPFGVSRGPGYRPRKTLHAARHFRNRA